MTFKHYRNASLICSLLSSSLVYAEIVPFDSDRWAFASDGVEIIPFEATVDTYQGREKTLTLNQGGGFIVDSELKYGSIEYDVSFPFDTENQKPFKGYNGAMWHIQNQGMDSESFYMRPHQNGNVDATQYAPNFNGVSSWQLYPQYSVPYTFTFDTWTHVKLLIGDGFAEIYVDDMDTPKTWMPLTATPESGMVGVMANMVMPTVPAHFSNFDFTPMDTPPVLASQTQIEAFKAQQPEPGTIMKWLVSDAFAEDELEEKYQLIEEDRTAHTWTEQAAEVTGLTQLSVVQGVFGGKNTAFARTTIVSDKDQVKPLIFGFSDKVHVYVNGQLMLAGDDESYNRDYRFLGTISYFDTVFMPLKQGNNEIWMAVTEEDTGGWAVQARLKDMQGISAVSTELTGTLSNNSSTSHCTAQYDPNNAQLQLPCINIPGFPLYQGTLEQDAPGSVRFNLLPESLKIIEE